MLARSTFVVLLAAGLIVTGCGTGAVGTATPEASESPAATPTPEGTTVTSDDGHLTISVPDGAVPEGTDVTITDVPRGDLPSQLQELIASGDGYRLEPDGLEFTTPITATLTINRDELDEPDDGTAAYVLASYSETFGREAIDSQTAYTLGEGTIEVTAELHHLSWITRTRGSLHVVLPGVERSQLVGRRFNPTYQVTNSNPDLFDLSGELVRSIGGPVTSSDIDTGVRGGVETFALDPAIFPVHSGGFHASCVRPGLGSYQIDVSAFSRSIQEQSVVTELRVTALQLIECVEPGSEADVGFSLGCVHIGPGESQLLAKVRVRDADGMPIPGATVEMVARRGGVYEQPGDGVTDDNGEVVVAFPINNLGTYNVEAVSVQEANGALLDTTRSAPLDFTVKEECTAPP